MLCVAVMLSVMVLGAGAAFSDQDKIENTEAVNMCSALNIIGGYEDGSFHPERNIKRSEITKMICVALNGGKDPNVGTNEIPTFTDVRGTADAWAEGYIESCVAQGIVSGVGGGRFAPAGNVTGSQLAKMLLVALGYNSDNEGFTGNAWETNVNVRAAQKHLYDGLEKMDTSAAITRDDAAQMVWNAMQAYEVEYKTTIVTDENGNLITQNVAQDRIDGDFGKITLLWDKYEALVATGSIVGAPSSKTNPKGITFDPDNSDKNIVFKNATQDVSDLLGYEVKVVWNTKKVNESDAIYGIYATDNNVTYETIWADVEQDGAKVKFDGTSYELDGSINVYADHWVYDNGNQWDSTDFTNEALSDVVTFIDNDGDGKIEAAQIKTQDVTKITYVSDSGIDTNGLLATGRKAANAYKGVFGTNGNAGSYDSDPDLKDVTVYNGIAKNDYAKVSYDYYNDKVVYEKIEAVEATVEATRTSSGTKEVRIDGTWYTPAEGYTLPSMLSGDTIKYIAIGTLLYNVEKIDGIWGSKNLAIVYDAAPVSSGLNRGDLEIGLITRDGSKISGVLDEYNDKDVVYTDDNDDGISANDTWSIDGTGKKIDAAKTALEGQLVLYRQDGNDIALMPVSETQMAGYNDYYELNGTSAFDEDNDVVSAKRNGTGVDSNRNIADDAVVFLWDGKGDADVISGKELKNATGATVYTSIDDAYALGNDVNGVNYVQALALNVTVMPTVAASNYAYVLWAAENISSEDGKDYREFSLWTENGPVTAYEQTSKLYTYEGGEIVKFENVSNENGRTVIKDVTPLAVYELGAITTENFDGKTIAIDWKSYDLASDVVMLNVDTDKQEGLEAPASDVIRAAKADTKNIIYVKNDKQEIEFLLVDGKNNEIKTVNDIAGGSLANSDLDFAHYNYVVTSSALTMTDALDVDLGKSLTVNGKLTLHTSSNNTIDGIVVVNGDLDMTGVTKLTVNGKLVVTGTITGYTAGTGVIAGTGTVEINGQGEVTANTFEANTKAMADAKTALDSAIGTPATTGTPGTNLTGAADPAAASTEYKLAALTAQAGVTITAERDTGVTGDDAAALVESVRYDATAGEVKFTTSSTYTNTSLSGKKIGVKITVSAAGVPDMVYYALVTVSADS